MRKLRTNTELMTMEDTQKIIAITKIHSSTMINTITTPMRNMYHKKETVEETRKISKASFLVCGDNEEKETQKRRGG